MFRGAQGEHFVATEPGQDHPHPCVMGGAAQGVECFAVDLTVPVVGLLAATVAEGQIIYGGDRDVAQPENPGQDVPAVPLVFRCRPADQ
jgi:hypothetical protein